MWLFCDVHHLLPFIADTDRPWLTEDVAASYPPLENSSTTYQPTRCGHTKTISRSDFPTESGPGGTELAAVPSRELADRDFIAHG